MGSAGSSVETAVPSAHATLCPPGSSSAFSWGYGMAKKRTQTLGGLLVRHGGFSSGISVYTPSRNSIKSSTIKRKTQHWEPGSRAEVTAADSAEQGLQRRKAPQLGHSHSKPRNWEEVAKFGPRRGQLSRLQDTACNIRAEFSRGAAIR